MIPSNYKNENFDEMFFTKDAIKERVKGQIENLYFLSLDRYFYETSHTGKNQGNWLYILKMFKFDLLKGRFQGEIATSLEIKFLSRIKGNFWGSAVSMILALY